MNRRRFVALLGGAAGWPCLAQAQPATKVRSIGILFPGPAVVAQKRFGPVMEGLRAAGYRPPEQVELVLRAAEGDLSQLVPLANDLIGRSVDIVVAVGVPSIRAVHSATATTPIIAFDLEADPVASGLIASYARPGGNITGVFNDFPTFTGKLLGLLNETVPTLSRVAVLWDPTTGTAQVRSLEAAAGLQKLAPELLQVSDRPGFAAAFDTASRRGADGLVILGSPLFGQNVDVLGDLALKHRLPAISQFPEFARASGLMAYGPNLPDLYRLVGIVVGKVLRGAKVAELPVERPAKFELVVNLNTAKALGVNIPSTFLVGADEVIE